MPMDIGMIVLLTVLYTLIGVRVAIVGKRAGDLSGQGFSWVFGFFAGALWPTLVVLYGFVVIITGETGIYYNTTRYKNEA